jgi:hypothetical protein
MLVAALGCAALVPVAGSARDTTLCVGDKPGCFTTIHAAVNAAHDGDTIKIAPGSYAGGITILKSVQLVGAGAGATRIEGGGPVITIGAVAETVSISGVTITGGLNNAAGVAAGGGVKIDPAPDNSIGATVTISDSVIAGNIAAPKATFDSPAPCGPVPFDECAFALGGGIDNSGALTVTRTRISGNEAGPGVASHGFGGGIENHPQGTLTLRWSLVTSNRAVVTAPNGRFTSGGGIEDNGVLTIEDSVVSGNSSVVSSAVASTFPFDIQQNANAGGIFSKSATITRTIVTGNRVSSSNSAGDALALAGGIDADDEGSLVLRESKLVDNDVDASVPPASGGSAIAAVGGLSTRGISTVRNVLVGGNSVTATSASGFVLAVGGGLGNVGRTTLQRTLAVGNSAAVNGAFGAAQGGGINNVTVGGPDPKLTLTDSVVSANRLTGSPGIDLQGGGIFTSFPVTLTRTIVAGNKPDQCFGC